MAGWTRRTSPSLLLLSESIGLSMMVLQSPSWHIFATRPRKPVPPPLSINQSLSLLFSMMVPQSPWPTYAKAFDKPVPPPLSINQSINLSHTNTQHTHTPIHPPPGKVCLLHAALCGTPSNPNSQTHTHQLLLATHASLSLSHLSLSLTTNTLRVALSLSLSLHTHTHTNVRSCLRV